jgi:hypothetical protein
MGMKRCVTWFLAGVLTCSLVRPLAAADTGSILGTVDRPADVTEVRAIDRDSNKVFKGTLDKQTGQFRIEGLPPGATYDCILDGAVRLEGVNLKVPHSDFEEEQPLSKDDIATLTKAGKDLSPFEDQVEVMTVVGNIQHAAVVLNKLRTKPFNESKPGEVVWRLEVWRFEKPEENWVKVQDELFTVLYRERLQRSEFDKKALVLDPALGGLKLTAKENKVDLGKITLPDNKPGIRLRKP